MGCLKYDGKPPGSLTTKPGVALICYLPGGGRYREPGGQPGPVPVPLFCPRYLDNIHLHPEEEKYQKIKLQNKVFQVRAVSSDSPGDSGQRNWAALVTQGPVWRWCQGDGPSRGCGLRCRGGRWRGAFLNTDQV